MDIETRWWWVRHAPVTANEGRIYGQRDMPADITGSTAALRALAGILPRDAVLLTSDLRRTVETAEALRAAGAVWAESHRDRDLREQNFGDWQGLSAGEFEAVRDRLPHSGWLAPAFERAPGGESFADVVARVVPAVIRHTAAFAGRDIVAVSHGGTIRAALGYALGLDPETVLSFTMETLSLTRLDHIRIGGEAGVWRIVTVNRSGLWPSPRPPDRVAR